MCVGGGGGKKINFITHWYTLLLILQGVAIRKPQQRFTATVNQLQSITNQKGINSNFVSYNPKSFIVKQNTDFLISYTRFQILFPLFHNRNVQPWHISFHDLMLVDNGFKVFTWLSQHHMHSNHTAPMLDHCLKSESKCFIQQQIQILSYVVTTANSYFLPITITITILFLLISITAFSTPLFFLIYKIVSFIILLKV